MGMDLAGFPVAGLAGFFGAAFERPGAGFGQALQGLLGKGPVIPIAGSGRVRLQPVAACDVAAAGCAP